MTQGWLSRRLRAHHLEALYVRLLHPNDGRVLAPKTVYEIHLVIRGAIEDAVLQQVSLKAGQCP